MRRRITFLHRSEDTFAPNQLRTEKKALQVSDLKAAREDRFTFGFEDLPQELWTVLKQCYELHIRWASPKQYTSIPPFVSRVSPGLHIFFTPQTNREASLLCPMIKKVFGGDLNCDSSKDSFSKISEISERFSASSTFQYYQLLPSIDVLVEYLNHKVCASLDSACSQRANSLLAVSYLDLDYDSLSHVVVLNAFWQGAPTGQWTERIETWSDSDKVEVGVLVNERPTEPEELTLGGSLTVVGEDEKSSATLFSFPARHHPLQSPATSSTFSVSILSPSGLHPTMRLSFPRAPASPPANLCALHAYFTLPSYIFVDKYQLSDEMFVRSKGIETMRDVSGETDLEAPDWVVKKWGSTVLLELLKPQGRSAWHIDLPLHLRYLSPSHKDGGVTTVEVPWPAVFWACEAEDGLKMSVNPFDRTNLGYDGLFGPKTMFYHLSPESNGTLIEKIEVPVLNMAYAPYIESGTVAAVLLGFLWICWKLWQSTVEGPEQEAKEYEKDS